MSKLPVMPYSKANFKWGDVSFGGYLHTHYASDGDIYDMENMSSDRYPLLTPRKKRHLIRTLTKPNGIYGRDGLYYVDGTSFYKDGVSKGSVSDSVKSFASIGKYIIILPDMKYYDTVSDSFGSMEASLTNISCFFEDGTYAGEPAEGNTIRAADNTVVFENTFKVGDAITISGSSTAANNTTIIVREIEGNKLRFYENSFTASETAEILALRRTIPVLDYVCENGNRLWGCKGDTVYASKLGDPFNFNVFDGLTTDSWACDVGSAGDFTGCVSYIGYPVFMKGETIYKVYGDRPSNFQLMESFSMGTAEGSHRSLAIAGETLFYLSRVGVVAYTGGAPSNISENFGETKYDTGVAGSDGVKYYISMKSGSNYSLYVYDTRHRIWEREDNTSAVGFAWSDSILYMLTSSGKIYSLNGSTGTVEGDISSFVEFGDFIGYSKKNLYISANKKGTGKLQIRVELDAYATLTVLMMFDSDGQWREIKTLHNETGEKKSFYIPMIPRRSDHYRIKLVGNGDYTLFSLMREEYSGSPY